MPTLYLPPSARYFEPMRTLPNGRNAYRSLEYDLVAALEPALVVDLGAGDADSYFTLCQSVRDHDVDALCYAVDEWADDAEKGEQDETSYRYVNHFAHNDMRGIAYLLQMSAGQASIHFDEGMIDLLRIDSRRFEEPEQELLAAWLPRVAKGGIVLSPGTRSSVGAESRDGAPPAGFRRWELRDGEGLTVLYREHDATTAPTDDLLRMAFFGSHAEQEALARWYAHAEEHLRCRALVRATRWGLGKKKPPKKR